MTPNSLRSPCRAWAFIGWLRGRYSEKFTKIDDYPGHQFGERFHQPLVHDVPPRGECLLAVLQGRPVGILMPKEIGDGVCEMNRMFVRAVTDVSGAGATLAGRLKDRAREMGFRRLAPGALPRHNGALALYRKAGFQPDRRLRQAEYPDNVVLLGMDLLRAPI